MSSTSGVLIRVIPKGSRFVFEGPYVDSMAVHHSDTMRFINKTFPLILHTLPKPVSTAGRTLIVFRKDLDTSTFVVLEIIRLKERRRAESRLFTGG